MAAGLSLDTHAVLWLHQNEPGQFSPVGWKALQDHSLFYSPMVLLELEFLLEVKRIKVPPLEILANLAQDIGLRSAEQPHLEVMRAACQESWTRDPFDRVIVAQARLSGMPLLSKDRLIRQHYDKAFW